MIVGLPGKQDIAMHFTKMHGQGNDFVVVGFKETPDIDFSGISKKLCDRNKGVGGDGLVAVLPSEVADFKMRIFNADGSEPEMCGNGVRCAAKYFLEKMAPDGLECNSNNRVTLTVETLAGVLSMDAEVDEGVTGEITVDMGAPILEPKDIPVRPGADGSNIVELEAAGGIYRATCVSMGNPHAVVFVVENPFGMDISVSGPALETHEAFPRKTNVEFVQVLGPNELRMRVWERGVGETLACGTGACATLVAAVINKHTERDAVVHLKGGDLKIEWNEETGHVFMTGPAVTVFEGNMIDM